MSVANKLRYDYKYFNPVKVSLSLFVPLKVAPKQFVQPGIMRLEILDQAFSRGRIHLRGFCRVILLKHLLVLPGIDVCQVEECQCLFEGG